MSEIIENLLKFRTSSQSKSYLIGLERGRLWAEDEADYFDLRRWVEFRDDDISCVTLPEQEEALYNILKAESSIEWEQFVRGWIAGVKEFNR